jgi:hypothetical protein
MNDQIPVAILETVGDEACILDVELASRLGMMKIRNIRSVIAENRDELELHGDLSCRATNSIRAASTGERRGRPGKAYYLNEGQALVLCALSRTPIAAQIRKALIDVFMAYRTGKIVEVKEHRRHKPGYQEVSREECGERAFELEDSSLQAFLSQPRALISVLARCVVRLDQLENGM